MEVKRVDISIFAGRDDIKTTLHYDNGRQEEKTISDTELIDIITNGYEASLTRLGRIPEGYIDAGISDRTDTFWICLSVPAGPRCINYFGEIYFVPFPECVFFFKYEKGIKKGNGRVFTRVKGDKETLYNYPFGNVYDNGDICWGNTKLPNVTNMYDTLQHIGLFYGSSTSSDLYKAGKNVIYKEEFINQQGLLETLKDMEEFPEEILVRTGKNLNEHLEDWMYSKN